MRSVAIGRNDARERLYAYSAHDTAVAALLAAFGIRREVFPLYATVALVELHRQAPPNWTSANGGDAYFVRVREIYFIALPPI